MFRGLWVVGRVKERVGVGDDWVVGGWEGEGESRSEGRLCLGGCGWLGG